MKCLSYVFYILYMGVVYVRSDLDDSANYNTDIKASIFPGCNHLNHLSVHANRIFADLRKETIHGSALNKFIPDMDRETAEVAYYIAQDQTHNKLDWNSDCPNSKYYVGEKEPFGLSYSWQPCCADSTDNTCINEIAKQRFGFNDIPYMYIKYHKVHNDFINPNQIKAVILSSDGFADMLHNEELKTISLIVYKNVIAIAAHGYRPKTGCVVPDLPPYTYNMPNDITDLPPPATTTTTMSTTTHYAPSPVKTPVYVPGGMMSGPLPFPPNPKKICHAICSQSDSYNTVNTNMSKNISRRINSTKNQARKKALNEATAFKWSFDGSEMLAINSENLSKRRSLELEIEMSNEFTNKNINNMHEYPRFLSPDVSSAFINTAYGPLVVLLMGLIVKCVF